MQEELNDDDSGFDETGNAMRVPKKRDIKKESKKDANTIVKFKSRSNLNFKRTSLNFGAKR